MFNKFKSLISQDSLFYGLIVVLVAILCFGLGRLSVGEITLKSPENKPIIVNQEAALNFAGAASVAVATSTTEVEESATMYVGSKNGTKYHLPWCGSASQIKEENKVFFSSKAKAEEAGYTPASNCKGI